MKKEIVTNNAPQPVGPYAQAVEAGGVLYLSGQIALDPRTGALCNGTFEDEARQVFANIANVLEAAGCSVSDMVRVDIFLTDMTRFTVVNQLYAQWLGDVAIRPARQVVEVSALPKGASLELSCIACKDEVME